MENKDLIAEFSEIDLDSVFYDNESKRKRSSILKQTRFASVDMNELEDFELKYNRKSQNAKRVSFADTFQVKELNTGNIYDIPGKNESSKEMQNSVQQSICTSGENKENIFDRCPSWEVSNTEKEEMHKEEANMSLSESVVEYVSPHLFPLNSTICSSHNRQSDVRVLSNMEMTIMHEDNSVAALEENEHHTCEVLASIFCGTHAVRHSSLKNEKANENCILTNKQYQITSNYSLISQEDKENFIETTASNLAAIHEQKNSFRVDSKDFDYPCILSSESPIQSKLDLMDILKSRSFLNSSNTKLEESPTGPTDIFHSKFIENNLQSFEKSNGTSNTSYKEEVFLNRLNSEKENLPLFHLQKSINLHKNDLKNKISIFSEDNQFKEDGLMVSSKVLTDKTTLKFDEMDLTDIISASSSKVLANKTNLKFDEMDLTAILSASTSKVPGDKTNLKFDEMDLTDILSASTSKVLADKTNLKFDEMDWAQQPLEVKVRSPFSDTFNYVMENECSQLQGQLKRSCSSTPDVVHAMRKIKKIGLNYKSSKEAKGNVFQVVSKVSKQSESHVTTLESVSINNTNFASLPSTSTNCVTSSKQTDAKILITSSFSDIPSSASQNLSPIKHKLLASTNCIALSKQTDNNILTINSFSDIPSSASQDVSSIIHKSPPASTNCVTSYNPIDTSMLMTNSCSNIPSSASRDVSSTLHKSPPASTNCVTLSNLTDNNILTVDSFSDIPTSASEDLSFLKHKLLASKNCVTSPKLFDTCMLTTNSSSDILSAASQDILPIKHKLPSASINCVTSSNLTDTVSSFPDNPSYESQDKSFIKPKAIASVKRATQEESTNTSFAEIKLPPSKTDKSTNTSFQVEDLKEENKMHEDNCIISKEACESGTSESISTVVNTEDSFSYKSTIIDSNKENVVSLDISERKATLVVENNIPNLITKSQSIIVESSYIDVSIEDKFEEKIAQSTSKAIPDSNAEKKPCEDVENKRSLSEKDDLSLEEFIKSFNETSSGKESRIKFKSVEDNRAVFKLKWGPWIYECGLILSIEQNGPDQSRIQFEKEDEEDWLVNLGYEAFNYLIQENSISHPFCNKKTILKLSEYSAIAYKVELLMLDLFKLSVSFAFNTSDNMDDFEVTFKMNSDEPESSYRLICPIDLHSYPDKKIVPKLKHLYLKDITEEVKKAISLVEPGKSYLWRIGKAAKNV